MGIKRNSCLYQEDIQTILNQYGIGLLEGKRFLVTGATGLIGVQLTDALMSIKDTIVYVIGRSKSKAEARLGVYFSSPRFYFIEQDVLQPLPEIDVDFVIPLASNTHPVAYSQYPIETILINTKGAEHALDLASKCGAIVLYPSTVEIYGNARDEDVFVEDYTGQLNLSNARSCYTESKRLSEALCQSYISEKNVDVRIVRLSRIFGPTVLPSDTKASSQFIRKAVCNEDIVLKSTGSQYFSYTYVADAVSAMLFVLLHGKTGVAYNISNQACNVHLKEFAELCASYNNKKVVFDLPDETEKKGFSIAQQAILDNQRLLSLGWQPQFDMVNAVHRTIEMIKEFVHENV